MTVWLYFLIGFFIGTLALGYLYEDFSQGSADEQFGIFAGCVCCGLAWPLVLVLVLFWFTAKSINRLGRKLRKYMVLFR